MISQVKSADGHFADHHSADTTGNQQETFVCRKATYIHRKRQTRLQKFVRHVKACLRGFRLDPTQTGLYKRRLEA